MRRAARVLVVGGLLAAACGKGADEPEGDAGSSGTAAAGAAGAAAGSGNGGSKGGASAGSGQAGTTAGSAGSSAGAGSGSAGGAGRTSSSGGDGTGGSAAGSAGATGGSADNSGGSAGSSGSSGSAGTAGETFSGNPVMYLGAYGEQNRQEYALGIWDVDKATGTLTHRDETVDAGPSPTYIAVSPSRRFLYVANEADDANGGLTALAIAADGGLTRLNHQTGSDKGLVYVAVTPNGKYAIGASYNGGSVSVFPIQDDGSLGAELDNVDFGATAQSHGIAFDASGEHVLVPNKGNDEVAQLLIGTDGMLTANTPARVPAADGAGPRHIALHPSGKFAFVINELDSSIVSYTLSSSGVLTPGATVSTLPDDFTGQNTGAHVEVTPDGHFLYGSNRGHDSIVAYAIDQDTGALTLIDHATTGQRTPRDFDLDPAGDLLIVAYQGSNTVSAFRIGDDGSLTLLDASQAATERSPAAVQIVYLPAP